MNKKMMMWTMAGLMGVTMAAVPSISEARGRQPDQAQTTNASDTNAAVDRDANMQADPSQAGNSTSGTSGSTSQENTGPRMDTQDPQATGGGAPANNQ
jgi:hypothetical protein